MKIQDTIYLDHQATTPIDPRVLEAMNPYLTDEFGNPHSADHVFGWKAAQAVENAATEITSLIGADPDEVVFTSGATESNNLALLGLARRAVTGNRRRVLVSTIEHKCVLAVARVLQEQYGFQVDYIPVDRHGRLDLDVLEARLSEDVLVVSVMAVNNEIGTIQDILGIAARAHAVGALFHTDAAQAPCAMDIDDLVEHADMASLSGHKMYGPKGIGALYIKRDLRDRIEPLVYGGGQQQNLRSGTVPTPLCVGMGRAATLLTGTGAQAQRERLRDRRDQFVGALQERGWPIRLNGPKEGGHPGNANICFENVSAHDVLGALQPSLAASTGSACTSGIPEPSHVLRSIGLSEEECEGSIRFSVGRYTTEDDVEQAVERIHQALVKCQEVRVVA